MRAVLAILFVLSDGSLHALMSRSMPIHLITDSHSSVKSPVKRPVPLEVQRRLLISLAHSGELSDQVKQRAVTLAPAYPRSSEISYSSYSRVARPTPLLLFFAPIVASSTHRPDHLLPCHHCLAFWSAYKQAELSTRTSQLCRTTMVCVARLLSAVTPILTDNPISCTNACDRQLEEKEPEAE